MEWLKQELLALISGIEEKLASAWRFLWAYLKEAVTEEEAALFPVIQAQAAQLLQDEIKTSGLTVKQRILMAEGEIMAALIADGKIAAATLVSAYVNMTAHKMKLVDGNQGTLQGGVDATPTT